MSEASPRSYTCPHCQAVSHNPNDAIQLFCGRCKRYGIESPEYREGLAQQVASLAAELAELLRGKHPGIIGGALAEATSMWLTGHFDEDPRKTRMLRERLLRDHNRAIRELIELQGDLLLKMTRRASH